MVDILRKEDGNLLHPILDKLQENVELQYYLKAILDGDQKRFYPGENKLQAQLELLGLIKADEKGYCRIRSLLYQHSLKDFYANMDLVAGQKIQIASGQIEKKRQSFSQILKHRFVTFPQNVGYFLLDIFGRENAKPQTAIILGYIFILIVIGNLQGIVRLDEVVTLLKGILELFGTK